MSPTRTRTRKHGGDPATREYHDALAELKAHNLGGFRLGIGALLLARELRSAGRPRIRTAHGNHIIPGNENGCMSALIRNGHAHYNAATTLYELTMQGQAWLRAIETRTKVFEVLQRTPAH